MQIGLSSVINNALSRLGLQIHSVRNFAALETLFYRYYHPDFFFVQIGANDGRRADPIQHLVKRHRLPGLAVEPLPDMFAELRRTYARHPQVSLANLAVHRTDDPVTLYRVKPDAKVPEWAHGIASLDPKHHESSGTSSSLIVSETVRACTLQALFNEHGIRDVDLFVVDTEGYDGEILKMLFETSVRPQIIMFEHGIREGTMSFTDFQEMAHLLIGEEYLIVTDYADAIGYRMEKRGST